LNSFVEAYLSDSLRERRVTQYIDMLRTYAELFGGLPHWNDFYNIPYPIFYQLIKDKIKIEQKRLENIEKQQNNLNKRLDRR